MSRFVSGLIAGRRLARLWLEADGARWVAGRGFHFPTITSLNRSLAAYIAADGDAACAGVDTAFDAMCGARGAP